MALIILAVMAALMGVMGQVHGYGYGDYGSYGTALGRFLHEGEFHGYGEYGSYGTGVGRMLYGSYGSYGESQDLRSGDMWEVLFTVTFNNLDMTSYDAWNEDQVFQFNNQFAMGLENSVTTYVVSGGFFDEVIVDNTPGSLSFRAFVRYPAELEQSEVEGDVYGSFLQAAERYLAVSFDNIYDITIDVDSVQIGRMSESNEDQEVLVSTAEDTQSTTASTNSSPAVAIVTVLAAFVIVFAVAAVAVVIFRRKNMRYALDEPLA